MQKVWISIITTRVQYKLESIRNAQIHWYKQNKMHLHMRIGWTDKRSVACPALVIGWHPRLVWNLMGNHADMLTSQICISSSLKYACVLNSPPCLRFSNLTLFLPRNVGWLALAGIQALPSQFDIWFRYEIGWRGLKRVTRWGCVIPLVKVLRWCSPTYILWTLD